MITTKVLFMESKRDSSNRIPLYIRITKKRRSVYLDTGIRLLLGQWDDKGKKVRSSVQNSTQINTILTSKLAKINKVALTFEEKGKSYSARIVKNVVCGKDSGCYLQFAKIQLIASKAFMVPNLL
jgi:integrase/recombinase XerD